MPALLLGLGKGFFSLLCRPRDKILAVGDQIRLSNLNLSAISGNLKRARLTSGFSRQIRNPLMYALTEFNEISFQLPCSFQTHSALTRIFEDSYVLQGLGHHNGRLENLHLHDKLLGFSQGGTGPMDHESLWPSSCWHQVLSGVLSRAASRTAH